MQTEHERIVRVYQGVEKRVQAQERFFGYENPAHHYRIQQRYRATLRMLHTAGFHPLCHQRILDVGCADGVMLRQFLQWRAQPGNLHGIDLRPGPVNAARRLCPNLDIRCGSAVDLPWPDASFDLVCQHTVFTSILSPDMKRQIAAEMARVLRPGGAVLWYDFMYNNPRNPNVRGVKQREIRALFPGFDGRLQRVTLAPLIARHIPESWLPLLYPVLAVFPPLRTHYLGLFVKP
ncbi:MAG: class I SAM-dependent methyltransferase [Anaerolineae bacterium]|nr:class I SAM-dependent methyltransferase [Anaerolineae bacterium]